MDTKLLSNKSRLIANFILGVSDGITVPFAVAAGVSAAVSDSKLVLLTGLSELIAGSISMGLGGYLAAKSEVEFYNTQISRQYAEISENPIRECNEIKAILIEYGLVGDDLDKLYRTLIKNRNLWAVFLHKNQLDLVNPSKNSGVINGLVIGFGYALAGLLTLLPYLFESNAAVALTKSVYLTGCLLIAFGWIKAKAIGIDPIRSIFETTITGGTAASSAYFLAHFII